MYTLSKQIRKGNESPGNKWSVIRDNGDFRRTVDFSVDGTEKKSGAIFQYIVKKTEAFVFDGANEKKLNTSKSIADYTDNNVKYMCDSYLEYFVVDETGSTFGDQFGNGAICKYDEDGNPILDRTENISRGTINQTGTAVFVPDGPALEKIKKGYDKNKWTEDSRLPANGLPYISYNAKFWASIVAAAKSNILSQSITITWGYKKDAKGKCINCDPPLTKDGGRRKTRKL